MTPATIRLDASRRHLQQRLLAPAEAAEPGQALAADWLSRAAGLGGPSLAGSLASWACAEAQKHLVPPVRRHPLLAVGVAAAAGVLLVQARWPRPLALTLAMRLATRLL